MTTDEDIGIVRAPSSVSRNAARRSATVRSSGGCAVMTRPVRRARQAGR